MAHLSAKVRVIGPSGSSEGLGQHQVVAAAILRETSPSREHVVRCMACLCVSMIVLQGTVFCQPILGSFPGRNPCTLMLGLDPCTAQEVVGQGRTWKT